MLDPTGAGMHLLGADGRAARQQEKLDGMNATVGEMKAHVSAALNDFVANHLAQQIVPVIEHYMLQVPALVQAQLDAYFAAQSGQSSDGAVNVSSGVVVPVPADTSASGTPSDDPPVPIGISSAYLAALDGMKHAIAIDPTEPTDSEGPE